MDHPRDSKRALVCRPSGARIILMELFIPRLTPWATLCRRSAAVIHAPSVQEEMRHMLTTCRGGPSKRSGGFIAAEC